MQNYVFHLSFLIDEMGYNRIDLVSFFSLEDLDNYIIDHFKSHQDVRKKYMQDISEFCLVNREFIQRENKKNKRNWTGSIVIIAEERDMDDQILDIHKIAVRYQAGKRSITPLGCARKIKKCLLDDNILTEIRKRKSFLFSQNELNLFRRNDKRGDDYFKKIAIDYFIHRTYDNEELLYFTYRVLENICQLSDYSLTTSKMIEDTGGSFFRPESESSDIYFSQLVEDEDYERLFEAYDLDEIVTKSNIIRKKR